MCSGLGADELHVVVGEDFGKARVLRQKAVAGMHGVGAGDLAGRENGRDIEIAVLGRRRADAHALVGEAHVHGVGVGGGMHRDGENAELLTGADHPHGDLAAIGDQDFIEHSGDDWLWSLNNHQRLAELDRLAVLEQNLDHGAGARGRNLVHGFHRFDDQQRVAGFHLGCRSR